MHKALLTILYFLIFWIIALPAVSQNQEQRFRIKGKIIESKTKKGIKKVPIFVLTFNRTVEADNKGEFFFNMPEGSTSFMIDYYPFDKKEITLELKSDTTILIELNAQKGINYIEEVEIIAEKKYIDTPSSQENIAKQKLLTLPAMIGERDILKSFSLTSGVSSSSEGAANMQVRGGLHSQNLYLLDGIPLYSTEHFFGMVSVYNPIIIKSAKLFKSDFPTEFGGKISSVVNVLTDDANLKKKSGIGEINLLSSKAALNIPIVKEKLAVLISGRISNYSLINLMSPFQKNSQNPTMLMHFGDINANMIWSISDKDKLKLTFFNNSDGINITSPDANSVTDSWIENKQQNIGLNWTRSSYNKTENHLAIYLDKYNFDFGMNTKGMKNHFNESLQILTGIKSTGISEKFNYQISNKLKLSIGGSIKHYEFSPVQIVQTDTISTREKFTKMMSQLNMTTFVETEFEIFDKHKLRGGLRLDAIGESLGFAPSVEPRLGYHGIFSNDFSISASISRMSQPIHRVANPGLGISFEMFLPSIDDFLPESSWNFSLGMAKDFTFLEHKVSVQADAWHKTMKNIVEFKEGFDVLTSMLFRLGISDNVFNIVTQGVGRASGIDFSLSISKKKYSITANYTLMKAVNQFEELNFGRPFAASTDIRNSISMIGEYKFTPNWILTSTWQFRSGKPITIPTYSFSYPVYNPLTGELDELNRNYQLIETERNNYRTKAFHKLDISILHTYKTFRKYDSSISFGLYNVYNRTNPFIYFITEDKNKTNLPIVKSISLFPILPSFSWSMRF